MDPAGGANMHGLAVESLDGVTFVLGVHLFTGCFASMEGSVLLGGTLVAPPAAPGPLVVRDSLTSGLAFGTETASGCSRPASSLCRLPKILTSVSLGR